MAGAGEALIIRKLRPPDDADELAPHRLVAHRDIEHAIRCLENSMRRRERMVIARRSRGSAGLEIDSSGPAEDADDRFYQRGLDALAAAGAMARLEREQNSLRRKNSAKQ